MFFRGQKTEWWSLYNPSGLITTFVAWSESDGLWSVLMNSEQHYFLQLFNDLLAIIQDWKKILLGITCLQEYTISLKIHCFFEWTSLTMLDPGRDTLYLSGSTYIT